MKKLVALIGLVALSASAQFNTNYFWTAGQSNFVSMNGLGSRLWPMTAYQSNGMVFALKQWNDQLGLTGTNKLDQKDYPAYCIWQVSQQHGDQNAAAIQSAADAKADIRAIKGGLTADTPQSVINQIKALLGLP